MTIGGIANAGQLVGILVDKNSYVYGTRAGDTPETVAANLASSVASDWIVNVSGASVTVPGASSVMARVVADASVMHEVRRQEQGFRITCWCPTPATRDVTASAIDLSLVGFQFIPLAGGSQGRLQYHGTLVFDQSQDALLYRRDLLYRVEYPTTVSALQSAMLFGDFILNAGKIYLSNLGVLIEMHLVVVRPFDGLSRGDVITDSARIASILKGERAQFVVRVAARMPGGD